MKNNDAKQSQMTAISCPVASRVDPTLMFNLRYWVISLMNIGAKTGGHAILLVEGFYLDQSRTVQRKIVQCDINALPIESEAKRFFDTVNIPGKIHKIRVFKGSTYQRQYASFPGKSYLVPADAAERLIAAIEADADRTQSALNEGRLEDLYDYQQLGEEHSLAQAGGGHNCSSYLSEKLADHCDIHVNGKKPKKILGSCVVS